MKYLFMLGFTVLLSNLLGRQAVATPAPQKSSSLAHPKTLWLEDDLDKAFQQAAGKRPIVVLTHADWCTPCKQLTYEVIETPVGRQILKNAVGIRINFEHKAGRKATKRFRVLGLPTTLVLSPKGQEIGRIVGYPGRRAYRESLRDLLAGKSDIAELLKRHKQKPNDLNALIDYAQARLVRGHIKEAHQLLKRAMPYKNASGARAMRIWGRYLLRVNRDGIAGTKHFLAAMKQFEGQPASKGFLFWAAKGYHLQNKPKQALALFEEWGKHAKNPIQPLLFQAEFMVHHKYPAAATELMVRKALQKTPRMAWLHYLLAQVRTWQNDSQGAKQAIQRAIALQPRLAIFRYYARKIR